MFTSPKPQGSTSSGRPLAPQKVAAHLKADKAGATVAPAPKVADLHKVGKKVAAHLKAETQPTDQEVSADRISAKGSMVAAHYKAEVNEKVAAHPKAENGTDSNAKMVAAN